MSILNNPEIQKYRKSIYNIMFKSNTKVGKHFEIILMIMILLSVIITVFESAIKEGIGMRVLTILEVAFNIFFTIEYALRVFCSPKPRKYILSFFGIIDLVSILPFVLELFFHGAMYFVILRSFRLIRVFRVFKLFNFINEGNILLLSIQKSLNKIAIFFLFVFILNICLGTIMYIVEGNVPNSDFHSIGTGIYWSIVTMTTVGYGDLAPVTQLGRILASFIMLIGYTIMAVPTGIVSAEFVKEQKRLSSRVCPRCGLAKHDANANFCQRCGADLED